jgi:uncharacterized membrane protein
MSQLQHSKNKIRVEISIPPLFLLIMLIMIGLLIDYTHLKIVAVVYPLFVFLMGLLIMAIGTLFDFGAKQYVQNLYIIKERLTESEMKNINREQLIMTLIYIGIGMLYLMAGILLSVVSPYIFNY